MGWDVEGSGNGEVKDERIVELKESGCREGGSYEYEE